MYICNANLRLAHPKKDFVKKSVFCNKNADFYFVNSQKQLIFAVANMKSRAL